MNKHYIHLVCSAIFILLSLTLVSAETFTNLTITGIGITISPSSSARWKIFGTENAFAVKDLDENAYRLWIRNDNGNVGIGTTNPTAKLEVEGDIKATRRLCIGNVCRSSMWPEWGSSSVSDAGGAANYVPKWSSKASSTLINSIIYESSGKVGIGTTSPTHKLNVIGDLNVTGKICIKGSNCISSWPNGSSGGNTPTTWSQYDATSNVKLKGKWLSNDGGNEGVYVATDGKVGIGTSSPTETLQVSGNIKATGRICDGNNNCIGGASSGNSSMGAYLQQGRFEILNVERKVIGIPNVRLENYTVVGFKSEESYNSNQWWVWGIDRRSNSFVVIYKPANKSARVYERIWPSGSITGADGHQISLPW